MKAKEYPLLCQCVEDGLLCGWNRAHKHTATPEPEHIRNEQHEAIMNEIAEWFDFDVVKTEDED